MKRAALLRVALIGLFVPGGDAAAATVVKAKAKSGERQGPAQLGAVASLEEQERDAQADAKRDEAIAELQKLLPTFDDGPQKADLLYRLAELYWDKAKYLYFQEFR